MNINISLSAKDLYEIINGETGETHYLANRANIRKLLEERELQSKEAEMNGYDISMFLNDHLDAVERLIINEPIEARTIIYEVMAQEITIRTEKINQQTDKILEEVDERNKEYENIGKIIGGIILAAVTFLILYAINS